VLKVDLEDPLEQSASRCAPVDPYSSTNTLPVRLYQPGSWGPKSIQQLIAPHAWRPPFERAWRGPDTTQSASRSSREAVAVCSPVPHAAATQVPSRTGRYTGFGW
jgi:hypothetical protein